MKKLLAMCAVLILSVTMLVGCESKSKVKEEKVSTYTNSNMNLLYDQQMKFDLVK